MCVISSIEDENSKILKDFTGPFKLKTFKKHGKSLQHQKWVKANYALLAPEATPFVVCMGREKKGKTFGHLKALFNTAYYITKNSKPFSGFEGLLELTGKQRAELQD
jgi:hypothetical protein